MQVVTETERRCLIDGPSGPLEALVEMPRGVDAGADLVICHPHPLHGGTMDNKVVHTLARAARDSGLRAVRFNFRGVGRSAGLHDHGRGEVDDLLAVVDAMESQSSGRAVAVAGFSFGAFVAMQAAVRRQASGHAFAAVLLVAPPVQYAGFDGLPSLTCPLLVVTGSEDDIVDPVAVRDWCARSQPSAAQEELPAGHFFHGRLPALKSLAGHWLAAALSRRQPAQ